MTVTLPMFSKGKEQRAVGSARAADFAPSSTPHELGCRRSARRLRRLNRRLAAVRVLEAEAPSPASTRTNRLTTRSFEVGQLGLPDLLLIRREILDTRSISRRASGGCAGPDRSGRQRFDTAMTLKTFRLRRAAWCALVRPRAGGSRETAPAASDAAEAPHKEAPNTVEVDEGMLRDLRITTRPVESRTGGELVVLLGELAVDQRAYAEVGTRGRASHATARQCRRRRAQRPDAGGADQPGAGARAREYLSASARLKLAEAALERKRGLAAEKIVPLSEVQEAESAAGEARGALRASRAAIAAFGVEPPTDDGDGRPRRLRAALAGRGSVIERTAVVGQMLDPATPAFRIGNLSTLWLTVHAFERDAVRIRRACARACRSRASRDRTSAAP